MDMAVPVGADVRPDPPVGPPRPCAVTRLTVTDFRCYATARVEGDARPIVLTGPNGAGKTNLLEAVSFLAPGRGLRRATLAEVRRRDAPPDAAWGVAAHLTAPGGPIAVGTGIDPAALPAATRRLVRIDGRTAASQVELGAVAAMVWLTPQMDRLFVEGAGNRRRFFDRLVYGFYPDHARHLSAYEQAMRERARLLKDDRRDGAWLSALEDAMATNGVAVAAARRDVVGRLRMAGAASRRGDDVFPAADLSIVGEVERALSQGPALAAEDTVRTALADGRRLDAVTGGAATGPHRSDLVVRHADKDMPAGQCSTGEQKALLIGIALANARLLAADRGMAPLLLLDEVAAHLDEGRRGALYDEILALGAQAWLTGTDRILFAGLEGKARFYGVKDATVMELA